MLEYVELKNFQKHEYKRVDFNEHITYITGLNGDGKSSIIRAIIWVAMNEGDSKSYRRTYVDGDKLKVTQETSVEIGIDGHTVKRVLSSSKNEYWVDGVKCTGFNRGVPVEVEKLFKMQSLNVSEQFSPLFLVGESSGGAVAKALNEVASLEEMDTLSATVNTHLRESNGKLEGVSKSLTEAEEQVNALSVYSDLLTEADELEKQYIACTDSTETDSLKELLDKMSSLPSLNEVKSILSNLDYMCTATESFEMEDVSDLKVILDKVSKTFTKAKAVSYKVDETLFDVEDVSDLHTVVSELDRLDKEWEEVQKSNVEVKKALEEFKRCPLCGKELNGGSYA